MSPSVARHGRKRDRPVVLTDEQWAALEPLIEACRPKGKTPPRDLRRTVEAIVWRHANGAKWRGVPAGLGPWWRAAQLFCRWSKLGAWPRLLEAAQARGVELGMAFLDGTSRSGRTPRPRVRPKRGDLARTGPPRGARPLARRLRHEGVRDRGRAGPRGRLRARAGPSARAAAGARAPRPPPPRSALGRGRPRLQRRRVPGADLVERREAGDPDPQQRGGRGLPRLHLQ